MTEVHNVHKKSKNNKFNGPPPKKEIQEYESHFNLASDATPEVGCCIQTPKEQANNKTFEIEEKLPSTDSMLLNFIIVFKLYF